MVFEEFKYRVLNEAFNIVGMFISNQITKPDYESQEKNVEEFYANVRAIARQEEKERSKILRTPAVPQAPPPVLPLETRVEGGTACLPCSRDHFSTVSSVLNEALRFARKKGIRDPEVMKRIGIALDEMNALERIDLAAENIVQLKGREKQLAEWGLDKSRELRHKITTVQTPSDLEKVASDAAMIRTEFMRNLWDIATADGTIEKLCKGLSDEERDRCVNTINAVLKEKKETPP